MYGAIIYQKAPIVMRHLEALLGEDNFRDGLREYLKAHAFANATWSDLITVLDARTPMDLQQWSKVWVDQPGRPSIETILETKNGTITRLAFRQRDPWNRNLIWPQQLRVAIGGHAPQQMIIVDMTGAEVDVPQGGRHAGAALRAAQRRRLGLRRFRSRQDDARLPDDEPAGHRRSADARQRVGDAVGCAARRTGARPMRSSI